MGRAGWVLILGLVAAPGLRAADPPDLLSQARLLYNERKFDEALAAAERARLVAELADGADLIAARAYLERYRDAGGAEDLDHARERLRRLDPRRFNPREQSEFVVGLGEALYFGQSYGAAAEVFGSVLDNGSGLAADARERVLDWWANATDREAVQRAEAGRQSAYQAIRARMHDEAIMRPASSTAAYWLAAAARAQGDLQAAWDAVEAGWVRASLTGDGGAALRLDLDRLMIVAIVPEKARATSAPPDTLLLEWETFKAAWGN